MDRSYASLGALRDGSRGATACETEGNLIDGLFEAVLDVVGEEPHDEESGALQPDVLDPIAAIRVRIAEAIPVVDLDREHRVAGDEIDLRRTLVVVGRDRDVRFEHARGPRIARQ